MKITAPPSDKLAPSEKLRNLVARGALHRHLSGAKDL